MTDRRPDIAPLNTGRANSSSTQFQFYLCFLYFVLKPFYLWQAGQPQIADFIIVLLLIVHFFSFKGKLSEDLVPIFVITGILVLYIAFVNLGWAGLRNDTRMGFIGTFYIFNFLILFFANLGNRFGEEFYKYMIYRLFASFALQFLLSFGFQNVGFKR